jgi:DNA mismatch repair protein MutS
LILDSATHRDLDVLSTALPGGATLLALVDRTLTRSGRERLRRRLLTPPVLATDICALQQAHRALATDIRGYAGIIQGVDLDAIETYLRSRWVLPLARRRSARYARYWMPGWYQQYRLDTVEGRRLILALLGAAATLRDRFRATDAVVLRELADRIAQHLESPDAKDLVIHGAAESLRGLECFDQHARERAQPTISALIECLGAAEAMWSVAAATEEHGWSYPLPGARLRITGLFHPFLGRAAVGNDLHLSEDVRICFVTGPNMAGKSTFLKAVALATLLAHCGSGVPAAAMEFPVVGTLFSSVQMIDSLGAGESFYLAEVRRMRALATALRDHGSAIAVIDEPFRGTNVHDAAEATLAVITRLAAHRDAVVFIASHLAEVVPAISGDPRILLLHFAADLADDQPRFDYRLRPGMSTQRLGMTLLREERVLELLEAEGG